jgi:S1-C subfamily serine protease
MTRWLSLMVLAASAVALTWPCPAPAPQPAPAAPPEPPPASAASPAGAAAERAEVRRPAPAPPLRQEPWFVEDERFYQQFIARLTELAEKGECLPTEKLRQQWQRGGKAACKLAPPAAEQLSPHEVYRRALPAVMLLGSVYPDEDGTWVEGMYATAWVAAAEGILVTNWHVFSELQEGEVFAAADYQGRVYPLKEILAADQAADVAVIRIAANRLTPLPLSRDYAPVGSWVAVLGHPGDNFYVFTTGSVTRYSTQRNEHGQQEYWMGVTAEFAGGSSGSPVLDARGAVVGMAALTLTLEDQGGSVRHLRPSVRRPPALPRTPFSVPRPFRFSFRFPCRNPHDDKPMPPAGPPQPPAVQMILKMAVPAPHIARLCTEP